MTNDQGAGGIGPLVIPASTAIAGAAGSLTVILVWVLKQWAHVDVPTDVAAGFTGLVTLAGAHFTKDRATPLPLDAAYVEWRAAFEQWLTSGRQSGAIAAPAATVAAAVTPAPPAPSPGALAPGAAPAPVAP